jgi:hypothetical protein
MRNVPKVLYNGTTLTFTLPMRPFTPGTKAIGGHGESGAGVPCKFVIRRDRFLDVVLRFYESEGPAVRAWLEWAQDATPGAFTVWPDAAVPGTSKSSYLVSPQVGEDTQPTHDQFEGTFEQRVKIRSADGSPYDWQYWGVSP